MGLLLFEENTVLVGHVLNQQVGLKARQLYLHSGTLDNTSYCARGLCETWSLKNKQTWGLHHKGTELQKPWHQTLRTERLIIAREWKQNDSIPAEN